MLQKPDLTTTATTPDDDEIDLVALVSTVWAGKAWVGGATLAALLSCSAYIALTPPVYQADALLQIEAGGNMLALPESMTALMGNDSPSTLAEMEIIRSRQVLGKAVAELKLDWQAAPRIAPLLGHAVRRHGLPLPFAAFARAGDAISLAYLEVPPDWLGEPMTLTQTGDDRFSITLVNGTTLDGIVGETVSDADAGFAINVRSLRGAEGREFLITHLTELEAIDRLSDALSVSERGRQTGIIDVRLKDIDRAEASRRLNAVITAYAEQNVSKSAAEAQKSLAFVESQLPLAEAEVTAAENALNSYRAEQQSIDLAFETESLLTESSSIEAELRTLRLKEEELKEKYTPNHPVYRQLLEARATLEGRLDELRGDITDLPETQREVFNLTRTLEVAQATYVELMNRAQELRVLRESEIGSVRIIDDAATQPRAIAPRAAQILALGTLLGLIAGIGGVLVRNWLRHGIDSAEEIERLGIPVFATVNEAKTARATAGRQPLIARDDPDDITVEALRSLRTSLHFGMLDSQTKSLVLTSSAPGAGKSFVAANLATVAAQAGQRVCLIDADMRRGTQRKYFGLPKGVPGLADYLAEDADLTTVLRDSPIPGLSLIMTGPFPPNPSELLMRDRLGTLIAALTRDFDLIIFDAPPALAVTDAVVIGRRVGTTIAVARHTVTPIGELEAVKKTLQSSGVTLNGAILNGYDPARAKAGNRRQGYGYAYANRYAYRRTGDAE